MKIGNALNLSGKIRGDKISSTKTKLKPYEINGEYTFNLDRKLKYDLDILIDDLKQNDDALIIIVAPEGSGKTVLESQIGYYCSMRTKKPWGVDNVHFDGQNYIDKSLNSGSLIVNALDESRRALNKMRGMSKGNVEFMNFLSECRSQNQIHIIVLPAYSDLEQYVAIHRVKMVIQVVKERDKETKRLIRGNFRIINTKSKSMLKEAWKNGYKEFPKHMITHYGKFDNVLCLNEKEYDNKKENAKKERYMSDEEKKKDTKTELDPLKKLVLEYHKEGKSLREIAERVKKGKDTVNKWIKEINNNMSSV